MTLKLLLTLPLAGLGFVLGGCARTSPEEGFWAWFQSNEPSLFDFEKDQERTFERLTSEIHRVDPNLTFEFGPKEDGRREFTISADGIRAAFPKLEKLYAAAPALPRWRIKKFRQRRKPLDLSYSGVSVQAQAVGVQAELDGQMVDLTVFIPGYSEPAKQAYNAIAFLLLDQALGEYDVEMRIARITIKPISDAPAQACSLEALPKVLDSLFAQR